MAELLTGKEVVENIKNKIGPMLAELQKEGLTPKILIIRVGARADDLFYERSLEKTCQNVGLACEILALPENISQEALQQLVQKESKREDVHGVLLFSPLPAHLDEKPVVAVIPTEKDVDCLSLVSAGRVYTGEEGFAPCTAKSVMNILAYYNIALLGKKVVVVGRSLVVGKPLAMLLLAKNATVTICHSHTVDLPAVCRAADILIVAIGKAKMIDASYVSPGQVVIDVGTNVDPDNPGGYCGDVDFASVEPVVHKITPVPGGVGAVTTARLCLHVVQACFKLKDKNKNIYKNI